MKTVIGISLGANDQDFAFNARFLRRKLDVRRLGTNGSTAKAVKLLKHWQQHADAIGLGVVKDSYAVGSRRYVEKDSTRMKDAVTRIPVTTGGRLNDILQEWALRHVQIKLGDYFNNARVLFFSGMANYKLATAVSEGINPDTTAYLSAPLHYQPDPYSEAWEVATYGHSYSGSIPISPPA